MLSPWKKHFPALLKDNISYLDSAATTQVPKVVIDSITNYLSNGSGNPGRGSYSQSENATDIIKKCRNNVADFIGSKSDNVIFTKSATEAINLIANSFLTKLTSSDSILVTQLEHHANLLPWQKLCHQTGARLNVLPITTKGEFDLEQLEPLLKDNCKLFAFSHCSNVIGLSTPVLELCKKAKKHHVKTLIDGAQAVSHHEINMVQINCDYYVFSGHKLYAGGGAGILYAAEPDQLEPLLLGGGIVSRVTEESYQLQNGIHRLEAGSSNMIAITALNAAINFVNHIGITTISDFENQLTAKLYKAIDSLPQYEIISHQQSASIVCFYHKKFHCHDIASILAESGISVRAGHHCAQPCLNALGIKHCLRASIGMYNDEADIFALTKALKHAESVLS